MVQVRGKGVAAEDGCADGFVPREARAGDNVCVTPEEKARIVQQDRAHADEDRANDDGTCIDRFVWREATPEDHICVTLTERSEVATQNAKSSERSSG